MATSFNNLREKMSDERRKSNKLAADRQLLAMGLQELRTQVANISQDDLAELLSVTQGYISKLERQDDMLLSRLYAYVEALGGSIEIRAKFPKKDEVRITQFSDAARLVADEISEEKQVV